MPRIWADRKCQRGPVLIHEIDATYVVVDHESQRVRDVALECHKRRPVKVILELDFAALEGVPDFRVLLRVDDLDPNKWRDRIALVTPQRSLVGERHVADRPSTVEVRRLYIERPSQRPPSSTEGEERSHVQVLHER